MGPKQPQYYILGPRAEAGPGPLGRNNPIWGPFFGSSLGSLLGSCLGPFGVHISPHHITSHIPSHLKKGDALHHQVLRSYIGLRLGSW